MNTSILEGRWKEVKGQVQQQWGKLTNDELDQIAGKRDELIGRLQRHYGYEKERINRELDELLSRL